MSFDRFGLDPLLLRAVADLGFTAETPIQADAIPPAMAGRDILACAMTGSGKTAAFLLPILHKLLDKPRGTTRVLILSPTRELAAQIAEHMQALAKHTSLTVASVFGGVGMGPQEHAFRRGVDVIVACPGRLLDHFQHPYAKLPGIEFLVLDEADRMLDMGFLPDVKRILAKLPAKRQNLLFSATIPPAIVELSRTLLHDPAKVNIERAAAPATGVVQSVYPVPQTLKAKLLLALLTEGTIGNALAFTRTKHRANRLFETLARAGIPCERIHGNRSQTARTQALAGFKDGRYRVLVATDIAARGIDVEDLSHVVNFDVPLVPDDYVHRVGRTARAEATGDALTFVAPDEEPDLRAIERAIGRRIPRLTVSGFDYGHVPAERFEIPIGERIAAIRARKADERARAKVKAERRAGQAARPAAGPRPTQARPSHPPAPQPHARPALGSAPPAHGRPAHAPASHHPARPHQARHAEALPAPGHPSRKPDWASDPSFARPKPLGERRPR
jgi:ATP-dependent RNA helicase RhlE